MQGNLSEIFAEHETVKRVRLLTDWETGRVRGFVFVEMATEAEDAAIGTLNGAEWTGRGLTVDKAKLREERGSSGGSWDRRSGSPRR